MRAALTRLSDVLCHRQVAKYPLQFLVDTWRFIQRVIRQVCVPAIEIPLLDNLFDLFQELEHLLHFPDICVFEQRVFRSNRGEVFMGDDRRSHSTARCHGVIRTQFLQLKGERCTQTQGRALGAHLGQLSGVTITEKCVVEFKAIFWEEWHRAASTCQGK
jgi:hypothetical protein